MSEILALTQGVFSMAVVSSYTIRIIIAGNLVGVYTLAINKNEVKFLGNFGEF